MALHETTRLALCRTGFLILCVVPTLFVGAAAVRYRSADYLEARREEWASVLSDKTGLDVRVGRISYPHWNIALLDDVVLLDPETQQELLRTRYVEVESQGDRWRIEAGQPEINAAGLPLLAETLDSRLMRGHGVKLPALELNIGSLTIRNGESAQTFEKLRGGLVTVVDGKRAEVSFHIAGLATKDAVSVVVERRRTESGPRTTCTFDTFDNVVPTGTLTPLWPWLATLGHDATFTGSVMLDRHNADPVTRVEGRLNDVELARLVSDRFPHHTLTGKAEISLEPLEIRGMAISHLQGTLQSHGPGTVSRSVLVAFGEQLDLAPVSNERRSSERLVKYSHLAFGFQLDDAGLSLTGYADPAKEGVIMASALSGALLSESENPVIAPAQFIRALSPQSEFQVPATREAKSLFDWLPLPSLVPVDNETEPTARNVRLRSKR